MKNKKKMSQINANDYWVNVKTNPGMFSKEYAIELRLIDGKMVTFFADKTLVREKESQPQLRVYLVSKKKHSILVLLPCETFETATRWVEVPL